MDRIIEWLPGIFTILFFPAYLCIVAAIQQKEKAKKSSTDNSVLLSSTNGTSEEKQKDSPADSSLEFLSRTSSLVYSPSTIVSLKKLFDKYPEFSDGKIFDKKFIDGAWRSVFKENVPPKMKRKLKRILQKEAYNEFNYQPKK